MSPNYSGVDRQISAVDLGMMQDMLWDVTAVPEPAAVSFLAFAMVLILRYRPAGMRPSAGAGVKVQAPRSR